MADYARGGQAGGLLWSAADAVRASSEIIELRASAHGPLWTLHTPETGRTCLWYQPDHAVARCLTEEGFSVRSRVYEYGGGNFAVQGQQVVFVNEGDQQLYWQPLSGGESLCLSARAGCRYADMAFTADGRQLVCVEEEHNGQQVLHRLVQFSMPPAAVSRQVIHEGLDFYSAPRISADGRRLLWISWQRPELPWTLTTLYVAEQCAGGWSKARQLETGINPGALQQPCFDQQGRVCVLNDAQGFWIPWREQDDGCLAPLPAMAADHAGAPWQMGGCNYLPLAGERYLVSWFEQGFGRLGLYDMASGQLEQRLLPGYARIRHLAVNEQFFYCVASHDSRGSAVLAIDRNTLQSRRLLQLDSGLAEDAVSRPQAVCFAVPACLGEDRAHAFFYPPGQGTVISGLPPLVVFLHGGPTSAAYPVFEPRIQFWTQRGFAVADLNYRGSTGFGRSYRQVLQGNWGVLDVQDALALVQHLAQEKRINPRQVFIRGASAGGYTALLTAAEPDVFAAAASWYGVSDPQALRRVTHKFEGDYLDWLLGRPDGETALNWQARTPLARANRIETPLIFFQGGCDVVVVPEQTRSMVQALRQRGVTVECHEFAEQGHGFRCAQRLAFALEQELAFYRQHMQAPRPG